MERQVIYRDRQEFQAADLLNTQQFTDESIQHLILDAITAERMYVGLTVTSPSATEIQIATGRLWAGDLGKVFRKDQAETISVFSNLPVQDKKWLTVSVIGQEQDTDVQPRDFLTDLQTGQTEPRFVAMENQRVAVSQITTGLESTDPQKQDPPTGYTVIAYVLLNTSGVEKIELAGNKQLMRLFDVWQLALANAGWISLTDPKIASLISDLARLAKMVKGLAYMDMLTELARDVALLKDLSNLPDSYVMYGADNFLDNSESDTANTEYYARSEEGIRFPWAGQTEQQPALFNPYATEVENFNGLILPAHEDVVRLAVTENYSGAMSISQYQYQTLEMKVGTRTRRRVRYGPTREVCTNGVNWNNGTYDAANNVFEAEGGQYQVQERYGEHNGHYWLRVQQYWVDTWTETYTYWAPVNHTINGCQIAQTFLVAQNGWLKTIDLYFDKIAADGVVYLHICETDLGVPNRNRCLGGTSVNAADLKKRPTPTPFTFEQPVFLEAGKLYAILVTTAGDHDVATVQGTEYTQGTIFNSTDGAYYQGDFSKDLMMRHHYALFGNTRTEVELSTISLAEGIADLDLLAEAIVPDSTDFFLEYQKEGTGAWYPIVPETAEQLLGLPAMLHLRAVFVGTQDLMPGLSLPGSRLQANRPATTFRHISTQRTLSEASENIDVIVRLEAWDGAKHTCTIKLISGGTTYTHDTVTDKVIADADIPTIRRTVNFLPEPGTGISDYQIQIEGTATTALEIFHVAQRMDVAK
jgi:hypothetical protein